MRSNQLFIHERELFTATRRATVLAVVLLSVQLAGNLYEQVVTNAAQIAGPSPGGLVDELAPGSPVFFYMPWVMIGVAGLVALRVQVSRRAAPTGRLDAALAAVGVAAIAKIVLITSVNPTFRDPTATADEVRRAALVWAAGNGVAIVAVAAAITSIACWRRRLADALIGRERPPATGDVVPSVGVGAS